MSGILRNECSGSALPLPEITSNPTISRQQAGGQLFRKWGAAFAFLLGSFGLIVDASAQTPGVIYKRAIGGASVLDPNGDGYTSPTNTGFSGTDQGAGSEFPYKAIPQISLEPTSDLGPGPNCGFITIVDNGAETGVSMFVDAAWLPSPSTTAFLSGWWPIPS